MLILVWVRLGKWLILRIEPTAQARNMLVFERIITEGVFGGFK